MQEKLTTLIDDFEEMFEKLPGEADRLKPAHVRVLADLGSVISTALMIKQLPGAQTLNNKTCHSLEDCIVDELSGADQKYMEYIKHQDPALLNMAKDELRHAAYYLSQAKMSPDHDLQQRLKEYHAWYGQIEGKLNKNYS